MTLARFSFLLPMLMVSTPQAIAEPAPACWMPVLEKSRLVFEIKQSDVPLKGKFESYEACLCIDEKTPGPSRVSLVIEPASVNTQLPELDRELQTANFFHTERWQTASFHGDYIHKTGEHQYTVDGQLTIRDITRNITVSFEFQVTEPGERAKARGALVLKRLDYDIGQGEWSDTRWLGNEVEIRFETELKLVKSASNKSSGGLD